jgi:hypothetical protein
MANFFHKPKLKIKKIILQVFNIAKSEGKKIVKVPRFLYLAFGVLPKYESMIKGLYFMFGFIAKFG